jgi:ssDNA-binding Zn-finger/Zn-ribbon topoisomerase 1
MVGKVAICPNCGEDLRWVRADRQYGQFYRCENKKCGMEYLDKNGKSYKLLWKAVPLEKPLEWRELKE